MVTVSNSAREIIVITEIILCYIISPFAAYSYIQLHSMCLKHSIMVLKRHPRILKITGICILYWFLFAMPLLSTAFAQLDRFSGNIQIVLDRLNTIFFPIGTIGIFITTAWRFWHIYFDLKHSSSQKNSEWKYHLDPSLVEHNFWLTHKKDYGSSSFTKKLAIIYYVVTVSMISIVYQVVIDTQYYVFIGHGTCVVLHGIVMIIVLILWYKTPPYSDHFFVREEISKVSIIMSIAIGFTAISVLYGFLSSPVVLMMLCGICGSILFFSTSVVSFVWIIRKIKKEEYKQILDKMIAIHTEKNGDSATTPNIVNNQSNNTALHIGRIVHRLSYNEHGISGNSRKSNHYRLHNVLSNQQTFKTFMQHLAKEFSMECLLCFAEIIQYKFLMFQRFNIVNPDEISEKSKVNFTTQCPLTDVVPLSSINQTFEEKLSKYKVQYDQKYLMHECKTVCFKLFEKYIQNGAALEVNVSYNTRTRLINLMTDNQFWLSFNITPNALFCLYDTVGMDMYKLMNGSYIRFKTKPEFKNVVQTLDELQAAP